MVIRIWHGYTTKAQAAAYERLLKQEVFTGIAQKDLDGYKGIRLLQRELETEVEFVTIMQFDHLDAVKSFVGEDYTVAYVPPEAQKLLKRYDRTAAHYSVRHEVAY